MNAERGLDSRGSLAHHGGGKVLLDRSLVAAVPLRRHARNSSKGYLSFIVCIALVSSTLMLVVGLERHPSPEQKVELNSYVTHAPIWISGDSDLLAQANASDWPGTGTPSDPIVISGYYINGTAAKYSIWVQHTTLRFVISDCHLEAWDYTVVELYNTSGATVQANLLGGNGPMIQLTDPNPEVVIHNNTVEGVGWIDIGYADDCIVSNNTMTRGPGKLPSLVCAVQVGGNDIWRSSENVRIENNTISNYSFSVGAASTDRLSVRWNTFIDNYGSVWVGGSSNISVSNNTIIRTYDGISFEGVRNSTAVNNNISGIVRSGIRMTNSRGVSLNENQMNGGGLFIQGSLPEHWNTHTIDSSNTVNGLGILYLLNTSNMKIESDFGQAILAGCTNISLRGQSVSNATVAAAVAYSTTVTLDSLQAVGNKVFGIFATNSPDLAVVNCSVAYSNTGVSLVASPRANLTGCLVVGSEESLEGILVSGSDNCSLSGCNVTFFSRFGIRLYSSADCLVTDCRLDSCGAGVLLESRRCRISRNHCINNGVGIQLKSPASYANRIDNNTLVGNGFTLGHDPSTWVGQEIDLSNSVNGKPLFYGQSLSGTTVAGGYGQIILSNCSEVTVSDHSLANNSAGILVYGSVEVSISNSSVSGNLRGDLTVVTWEWTPFSGWGLIEDISWDVGGIVFIVSYRNSVEHCTLTNNTRGVFIGDHSENNVVSNCTFEGNEYGLVLSYNCSSNTVSYCNISTSVHPGIMSYWSNFNSIHHNVFYRNNGAGDTYDASHSQACTEAGMNFWNSTSGGNYWSDWITPDDDHDGIVDSPYPIVGWDNSAVEWDYLPLTSAPPEVIPEFSGGSLVLVFIGLIGVISARSLGRRHR